MEDGAIFWSGIKRNRACRCGVQARRNVGEERSKLLVSFLWGGVCFGSCGGDFDRGDVDAEVLNAGLFDESVEVRVGVDVAVGDLYVGVLGCPDACAGEREEEL